MVQKTYSRQNCHNDKCQCEYKKLIKIARVKKSIPEILVRALVDVKFCEVGKYLKNCECINSLTHDLVITCDEY